MDAKNKGCFNRAYADKKLNIVDEFVKRQFCNIGKLLQTSTHSATKWERVSM